LEDFHKHRPILRRTLKTTVATQLYITGKYCFLYCFFFFLNHCYVLLKQRNFQPIDPWLECVLSSEYIFKDKPLPKFDLGDGGLNQSLGSGTEPLHASVAANEQHVRRSHSEQSLGRSISSEKKIIDLALIEISFKFKAKMGSSINDVCPQRTRFEDFVQSEL
jgi:hypothetical protein